MKNILCPAVILSDRRESLLDETKNLSGVMLNSFQHLFRPRNEFGVTLRVIFVGGGIINTI